jgi:GAF domain-containing protein
VQHAEPSSSRSAVSDPDRLGELEATGLLDSPPLEPFERIVRLAERLLDVPVALVSLVTNERQFFAGQVGLRGEAALARQTPLTHSFCQFAVERRDRFVVEDASRHPLVHDNPVVADEGVAAYAGQPLELSSGNILGTLCVIDHEPRSWSDDELELLSDLAAIAVDEIEYRLRNRSLAEVETLVRRMEQPVEELVSAVEGVADAVHRLHDPVAERLVLQARARLRPVQDATTDLLATVADGGRRSDPLFVTVDLGERLLRSARIAAASVRHTDIQVTVRERPLSVRCDSYGIEHALTQLLITVMNHASGTVRVTGDAEAGDAHVHLEADAGPLPIAELTRTLSRFHSGRVLPGPQGREDAAVTVSGAGAHLATGPIRATTGPGRTEVVLSVPRVGYDVRD